VTCRHTVLTSASSRSIAPNRSIAQSCTVSNLERITLCQRLETKLNFWPCNLSACVDCQQVIMWSASSRSICAIASALNPAQSERQSRSPSQAHTRPPNRKPDNRQARQTALRRTQPAQDTLHQNRTSVLCLV
jgi:hypothetical protein